MAYSVSIQNKAVFGNQRAIQAIVTGDAESGVVSFGLSTIDHLQISPISMATAAIKVTRNAVTGTSAGAGSVNFGAAASGDTFYILALGR